MHRLAEFPTPKTLRLVTAVAFLFTAAIFFVFRVHDRPLRPYDIVAFELAWTPQKAETIIDSIQNKHSYSCADIAFWHGESCAGQSRHSLPSQTSHLPDFGTHLL